MSAAIRWIIVASAYVAMSCLLTWPLPLHLQTHSLGDVSGDTGTYIWNLWVFRHELIDHRHLPFSTSHIFGATGGADFSLHNYAPLAGLLGLPLVGTMGVVGAFNVVLIALLALSGFGVFLLARRLGLGPLAAWMAGAVFIASPVITAKATAHFSLINAAPLPIFLVALLRTLDTRRTRDAALAGALVALASYSDAYYGIYCMMMGGFVLAWRFVRIEFPTAPSAAPWLSRALNVAIALVALVIAWRTLSGTTTLTVGPFVFGLATLYTPVLVLILLIVWRLWLAWRPVWRCTSSLRELLPLVRLGFVAVGVCLLLLLPPLIGIANRIASDRLPETTVHWRSSPRGVDALAYVVPNPNHVWFRETTHRWLMPEREDAFPEFVGSFSIIAFMLIAAGAWVRGLPRFWVAFTAFFMALSLGPFIHVAGVNTYVIGPWALLRYVPVIGMARSPSRFAIVAVLGLSLLVAFALSALYRSFPARRTIVAGVIPVALAIELLPMPRPMYSVAVPEVYRLLAARNNEEGRLLELPGGVRDGTSSFGDFNAATLYFQTSHGRPIVGGALSRVSRWRREQSARRPMLRALYTLSEGRSVPLEWRKEALNSRAEFLTQTCLKFVLVNKRRATNDLLEFAVEALDLMSLHEDDDYALFTLVNTPTCEP